MKPKIQRSDSSSFGFRRERGFPGVQVCVHRGSRAVGELVGAAVSLNQETSDQADRSSEDKDSDPGQAMLSVAGNVSEMTEAPLVGEVVVSAVGEWTGAKKVKVAPHSAAVHVSGSMETLEVDVALPSAATDVSEPIVEREVGAASPSPAGDVSESMEAREVDAISPLEPGNGSESTEAGEVDAAVPSASGVVSHSTGPLEVDVVVSSRAGNVSESIGGMEVDVAMPSTVIDVSVSPGTPAVHVDVPSEGGDVSGWKTVEGDAAMPSAARSAAGNTPESAQTGESDVGLARGDPGSELVECIHHFCPTSRDSSDAGEGMDSKLNPELLKAAAHAVEAAGNEGLCVRQLARVLSLSDCEALSPIAGIRWACESPKISASTASCTSWPAGPSDQVEASSGDETHIWLTLLRKLYKQDLFIGTSTSPGLCNSFCACHGQSSTK